MHHFPDPGASWTELFVVCTRPLHSEGIHGGEEAIFGFYLRAGATLLPAKEQDLCQLVEFLKMEDLKYQTTKFYLLVVRHLQISQGLGDPKIVTMPRLKLVVRGLNRDQPGVPGKTRLSITPAILGKIYVEWEDDCTWDHSMPWACMCLCFFSFLQAGEAVIENDSNFDPSQQLSFPDISVDSTSQSSFIRVRI